MFPARSAHAAGPAQARLDAEKPQVYAVAVEFQTLAAALLPKGQPVLREQLERSMQPGAGAACAHRADADDAAAEDGRVAARKSRQRLRAGGSDPLTGTAPA